jgi:ABC-type Fe3+/spermidine/putrescine transport system ATPase subunit
MSAISLRSLTKSFGSLVAVRDLDLELREGELIAFLGPSGCGKTTTLRMIAGFEQADSGEIYLGGREVSTFPPERRNAGMVFQNYALFPHLTVFENVAFGLKMRKVRKAEIAERVGQILDKVQLTGMEQRLPRQLSGGQQQRTALARALVINPAVLLLDEPLANLDAKLREEMRFYIRNLQQEFGITTVYVTHDQAEALVLADRVAVMRNGVLQQIDAPQEVYRRPRNAWVANFVGIANLIGGTIESQLADTCLVRTGVGLIRGRGAEQFPVGTAVVVSVRPESLRLEPSRPDTNEESAVTDDMNRLCGTVEDRAYLGSLADYRVRIDEQTLLRVQSAPFPVFNVGDSVALSFAVDETWLVRPEGETAP